jgi:hypothetical protein
MQIQGTKMTYLLTWGLGALKITCWMMSGEVMRLMKPFNRLIKVSPPVLNHITQQRYVKHIINMCINTHIIDHEIKLMKMGGREEIMLERESISRSSCLKV